MLALTFYHYYSTRPEPGMLHPTTQLDGVC